MVMSEDSLSSSNAAAAVGVVAAAMFFFFFATSDECAGAVVPAGLAVLRGPAAAAVSARVSHTLRLIG